MRKIEHAVWIGLCFMAVACGLEVQGDTVFSELAGDEARAFCEERNSYIRRSESSIVAFNCYFAARQEAAADPSLDCETLAADCIETPTPGTTPFFNDCSDPDLATDLGMNCPLTVDTVRTCFERTADNFELLAADGLSCMNLAERFTGLPEIPECDAVDNECPNI